MDGFFLFLFWFVRFLSIRVWWKVSMEWKTVQAVPLSIYAECTPYHTLAVTENFHDSRVARTLFPNIWKV